jgi:hypothetical protein
MIEAKELFEPPAARERMPLGEGVLWAARNVLSARGTAWSVLITIAVSLPLYLMGYHAGGHPIGGFWLAMVLGAVAAGGAMGVMVASLVGGDRRLALTGVACQLRSMWAFGLWFGLIVTVVILGWRAWVPAQTTAPEAAAASWFLNDWASVWKPLGQVTSLAVLHLVTAPFAALAVPALAVAGGSGAETVAWMRWRLHHKTYDAIRLGYWGMTLALLAFVPWVGLLALPLTCLLLVRVFHFSFRRQEGVVEAVSRDRP